MRRILLVDDNASEVRLIVETLKEMNAGIGLDIAEDGEKALKLLKQGGNRNPDLILLDLKLPRKRGTEVLEEIKKQEGLSCIPVVVLTSSSSEKDKKDSLGLGADAFMSKPVALDEYISMLTEAMKFMKPGA